ncbi:zinc finger CCCH domain-containing protein 24-like [Phragmites australis]|uniref:zinc finger CCCH domain-containing protein 24-like n=1 Tax=Phragmites australis TaxID=29695 RepID=UPI002D7A0C5D|nr:zinc finger CCCH domain-containing protein 24-like [Phragmites australis]XP_062214887.1 zinc finger CCCH domain-containing protein 24-like [Phragmites australis]
MMTGMPISAHPAAGGAAAAAVAEMAKHLTVDTDDAFASLLELAADDDAEGLRRALERAPPATADEAGLWYGRRKVLEHRTPLMVAATYGSLAALRLLLSLPSVDVNRRCDTTALHCAASGGSRTAVETVKLLLSAGADADATDDSGRRPADVISVPPKMFDAKFALQDLLGCPKSEHGMLRVVTRSTNSFSSPVPSPTAEDARSPSAAVMMTTKFADLPRVVTSEKKEYPVDPSLPDIKNSIYASDEFRMYSFKIRPCSRAYSHDWTECPFVHPGENARRRDPRKYHYSCVPCPDFRKGVCRRGDMCEYAHGVFECWLHPAQYRTRLCKDGTSCSRRVCFFAHTTDELRPLYVSTGSAVPSPRASATAAMEMAAAMSLMPGSPSSVSAVMSPFTSPMSPSGNGMPPSLGWQQPNVPTLHLPGSSLQSSRLRTSLNARDMPADDYSLMQDLDSQLMNDLCYSRLSSTGNHSARTKSLNPSNLDDLFSAEMVSSPRYGNAEQGAMFSPSHKAAILNQFQQQQQALLSPINTGVFSPKAVDNQQLPSHSSLLHASLGISSPGRMSPRCVESGSPMSSHLAAALVQREKQQQTMRSLSSRDLGPSAARSSALVGSPLSSSWSKWGSPSGTPDWGVNGEELGKLRRSSSFELRSGGDDPDLSWVHTLVKESPPEKQITTAESINSVGPSPLMPPGMSNGDGSGLHTQLDGHDQAAVIGALLEQMQLDQQIGSLAT